MSSCAISSTFLLFLLQSEIFDHLLEEAEQMHVKRREATEMLKVRSNVLYWVGLHFIGLHLIMTMIAIMMTMIVIDDIA